MALAPLNIHAGAETYLHFKAQTSRLVTPTTVADPAAQTSIITPVGVASFPGTTFGEGFRPVEGIGDSRDQGFVPGVREYGARIRAEIADGAFLAHAIRSRLTSAGAMTAGGLYKGMQLLTLEAGIDPAFDDAHNYQFIDGMINSLRLDIAENQNVVADMDVWAAVALTANTGQTPVLAPADVLYWSELTFSIGGTDYKPLLSRVSINVSNSLRRIGQRNQMGALGSELAISRTPLSINPGQEKLQLSYGLYDRAPAAMGLGDWGTITARAEQPGTGAGRKFLQIVISHAHRDRLEGQQATAGNWITYNLTAASRQIAITSGVSSA